MGVDVEVSTKKQQYIAGDTIEGEVTLYVSSVSTPTLTHISIVRRGERGGGGGRSISMYYNIYTSRRYCTRNIPGEKIARRKAALDVLELAQTISYSPIGEYSR